MKILVTGGTVFVSKKVAEYFAGRGYEVYVINRNTRKQPSGVRLIEADRHDLGDKLKDICFDAVIDVTAYTAADINSLLNALGKFGEYVMISSSAVYPETLRKPFRESDPCGPNKFWKLYGTDKADAEKTLLERVPEAYILRPAYIYGEGNNLYREAFVFDCADADYPFYLPKNCNLSLQFSYIGDLCGLIEAVLNEKPSNRIINAGDSRTVTAEEWVKLCYAAAGKTPKFKRVEGDFKLHKYFPFMDYDYEVDVTRQNSLIKGLTPTEEGLRRSYEWYKKYGGEVNKKNYLDFIRQNIEI